MKLSISRCFIRKKSIIIALGVVLLPLLYSLMYIRRVIFYWQLALLLSHKNNINSEILKSLRITADFDDNVSVKTCLTIRQRKKYKCYWSSDFFSVHS